MTIKQNGGIFGRNPTFNNVTVDGALSGLSSLTLTGGNLVFSNGNGIDFSATSGTGTSELFDDYEEGTCTVTLTPASGSITLAGNTLNYTKIGRQVTIIGRINASAGSVFTDAAKAAYAAAQAEE